MFKMESPLICSHPNFHEGLRARILSSIIIDMPEKVIYEILDLHKNTELTPYNFELVLSLFLLSRKSVHVTF